MTLEHATTKTSGFRFTLAHSRGVFYEKRAGKECVPACPHHNRLDKETKNGVKP